MRSPSTRFEVVGGGLVLASAALAAVGLLGGADLFRSSNAEHDDGREAEAISKELILPLPPTASPTTTPRPSARPSGVPSAPPSASLAPSPEPSASARPSSQPSAQPTATPRPSAMPSGVPSASAVPTGAPSSLPSVPPSRSQRPSTAPSSSSAPSRAPTEHPTEIPTTPPSRAPTAQPTELLDSLSSTGTFRLRLHWQRGYLWQESPEESWFCMACARCDAHRAWEECAIESHCEEGMMLATAHCQPDRRHPGKKSQKNGGDRAGPATFTLAAEGSSALFDAGGHSRWEGHQLQVHGTDLCLHRAEHRHVVLRRCSAAAREQRFLGVHPGGQAMELVPLAGGLFWRDGFRRRRCLTQHHHPKQGERIFAGDCDKAERSDTNLWSTY